MNDLVPQSILRVKVIPQARTSEIVGFRGEELVIKVTTAPEKGKANASVIKLLAEHLDIAPSQIELVQGATQSRKKFKILGVAGIREKLESEGF